MLRNATKNHLHSQLDRSFLGSMRVLPSVLCKRSNDWLRPSSLTRRVCPRWAAAASSASARPAACRSASRLRDEVVAAAKSALPIPDAAVACAVLAADLALATDLDV